ncbi:MAG: Di- and tricarboxylate transporter [Candidatus Kentron sp. G]|nr:MAG: Di- and tricarboxylate transporter [Candidatus Kentron sp. G]VFM99032.1 MAG: Di- and tricarboxylate transporter [Candidatus Kentron sp. G]VFN00993.1 MAG: Di- and tricarboxylate transporter [Candidatus Kentron sp. G]
MTLEAWIAVAIVGAVFALLALGRHPPYLILLGGLTVVLVSGIIEPTAVFVGFANTGLITVGILFVVAAGLRQTGALAYLVQRALGRPRSATQAQMRLVPPVVVGSAFLNNTPVVAMLMPVVMDWCKATRIPASRLLLPLSYTAILGGLCTMIGTSTNMVVNGLLIAEGKPGLGLFDITWVGLPCAIVGTVYLLLAARKLLPARKTDLGLPKNPREYAVEMTVAPSGPIVGKSIEAAGLRHLPSLYLMEVYRRGRVLATVSPTERLEAGDQLVFVGVIDSIMDLQRIPGLLPATYQLFKLESHRANRCFSEAVVSQTCPLIGQTIRDGRFRNKYSAVVIAVSRNGERIPGRIGDIKLHAGDALLLEAHPSFVEQQRNSKDFYLVSRCDDTGPPTNAQAQISLSILIAMVVLVTTGLLSMLQAAFAAAAAMLLTRCCSEETARGSIDWPLLLSIGAAFGLGRALENTGAAMVIGHTLLELAGTNPLLALIVVYGVTTMLSELVTNNAAAIVVFPIAMATAAQLGVDYMPFAIAVMIAASASFATPLGYQTNLMVYGPGGYRLSDFLKMGAPMSLLMWVTTCLLTPLIWPF